MTHFAYLTDYEHAAESGRWLPWNAAMNEFAPFHQTTRNAMVWNEHKGVSEPRIVRLYRARALA